MIRLAWSVLQWIRQIRFWKTWVASIQRRFLKVRARFSMHLRRKFGKNRRKRDFAPQLEALEVRMMPATYTVTSAADPGTLTTGTLRWAVSKVNAVTISSDTIQFSGLSGQTITMLQGRLELSASSLSSITIEGANSITICGDNFGSGVSSVFK